MPFNGSGQFLPLSFPIFPAQPGTLIKASDYNANLTDIFSGLSNAMTRDGQSPAMANIPMGGYKFTGLAAANSSGQALVWGQDVTVEDVTATGNVVVTGSLSVQGNTQLSGGVTFGDAAGDSFSVNSTTISWTNGTTHNGNLHTFSGIVRGLSGGAGYTQLNPGSSGYSSFLSFHKQDNVRQAYIGMPSTPTFVDMNGEVLPFRFTAKAPQSSVAASVNEDLVRYQEFLASVPVQATETVAGKAEIATQSETDFLTDDARIVTPKKLGNGFGLSVGTNGYIKFPSWLGGLVIQWGRTPFSASTGGAGIVSTFATTFPNNAFIYIGNSTSNSAMIVEPTVLGLSSASVSIFQRDGTAYGAGNVYYLALGN